MQLVSNTEPSSGPDAQLEELFRVHGRDVFKTAFRVTGSESDAEDVVQTVFLRLLANRHTGRCARGWGSSTRALPRPSSSATWKG